MTMASRPCNEQKVLLIVFRKLIGTINGWPSLDLLGLSEIPVVQIATSNLILQLVRFRSQRRKMAYAEIRGKTEPGQVGSKQIAANGVDLAPDVCEIPCYTCQGKDVDAGLNRAAQAKEKGHPDEIEAELNRV